MIDPCASYVILILNQVSEHKHRRHGNTHTHTTKYYATVGLNQVFCMSRNSEGSYIYLWNPFR